MEAERSLLCCRSGTSVRRWRPSLMTRVRNRRVVYDS
jgi:hypothetical protein